MTETGYVTSHPIQHIQNLLPEQVPDFISNQQRNRALTALIKQLNATLLSGQAEQREGARIALEKLGFIDV
ncbi:hypothetical protein [Sulfitobacter sp. JB4-11]|uniref:hypothetical protein n=1 Tax=Sulfitobacter rhodophyticola TaxID=3238304 RepID=UPI0035117128